MSLETYFVSQSEWALPCTDWRQSWRTLRLHCLAQVPPLAAEASMPLTETPPANHLQVWKKISLSSNTQLKLNQFSFLTGVQSEIKAHLLWLTKQAFGSVTSMACRLFKKIRIKTSRFHYIFYTCCSTLLFLHACFLTVRSVKWTGMKSKI